MNYRLYRLTFSTSVHFGSGRLGSSDNRFLADRLFSALCSEAVKNDGYEELQFIYESAKHGKLLISDSMPFSGKTLFLPKPIVSVEHKSDEISSVIKKEFKKLSYIPSDKFNDFFSGKLDAAEANRTLSEIGEYSEKTSAAITDGKDAMPYNIGLFTFSENCGLYFIIGYEEDTVLSRFDAIIHSLGYSGIGGKISSGLGKFNAENYDVPDDILKLLNENDDEAVYISLSVCMAREDELKKAVSGAEYAVIRRSGFVNSTTYSNTLRKRKDLFCFSSGSSFRNRFEGDVFDLSDGGNHPVYRYAKPLFMGVKI